VTTACNAQIFADEEVAAELAAAETTPCTGEPCSKCHEILVDDLIEDESLEDALERGYVPVILED
jgi:hypothetical protein